MKLFAASMLVIAATSISEAKPSLMVNEFCGDRYCGQATQSYQGQIKTGYRKTVERRYKAKRKHRYSSRHHRHSYSRHAAADRTKASKPIQVSSIGPEPLGEAARVATGLLAKAKSYLGGNPTGWRSLWCARFIAFIAPAVAETLKSKGLNPNWARDYALLPGAKREGSIGDIVVLSRGRGGHIGILDHFDKHGNPVIVSGNHGRKVGIGTYSKRRVIAYASL